MAERPITEDALQELACSSVSHCAFFPIMCRKTQSSANLAKPELYKALPDVHDSFKYVG
jgi:hypothetical protein